MGQARISTGQLSQSVSFNDYNSHFTGDVFKTCPRLPFLLLVHSSLIIVLSLGRHSKPAWLMSRFGSGGYQALVDCGLGQSLITPAQRLQHYLQISFAWLAA